MVARHVVVLAFFGLGHGARRLTAKHECIQGLLPGGPPGYKVKIAKPIRMIMIKAIAYLSTLVNPIQVRRCCSKSGSTSAIAPIQSEKTLQA